MFHKKAIVATALTAAAGMGLLLGPVGVAAANTLPSPLGPSYGFDGNAHLIVGGGSTTLYKIAQGFADLYNQSASCATNNSNADPDTASPQSYPLTANGTTGNNGAYNQCDPSTQPYTGINAGGNYDGDTVAIASAAGSSTGIGALNGYVSGSTGTYAYEGTNENIATTGDPNGITIGASTVSNGFGTPDFSMSSRAAKTSGGNADCTTAGDELGCDTFWGVAADTVEVFTFDATNGAFNNQSTGFTAADLAHIWECDYTTWGQLYTADPALNDGLSNLPPAAAPIVPWSMNSGSGTYADFDNYVAAHQTAYPSFKADDKDTSYVTGTDGNGNPSWTPATAGKCAREISGSTLPLENDVKPLLEDVQNNEGGLQTTDTMSTNNPANWIWFGSYGLLSAYQYLSQPDIFGTQFNTAPVPVAGILPSTSKDLTGHNAIPRILSMVTKKTDADCPVVSGACNFTNTHTDSVSLTSSNTFSDASASSADVNVSVTGTGIPTGTTVLSVSNASPPVVTISAPATVTATESVTFDSGPLNQNGSVDMNVLGAGSGKGGAVREFVRFLCRTSSEADPIDPFTGVDYASEISSVISGSGFTEPNYAKTAGSNCDVISVG